MRGEDHPAALARWDQPAVLRQVFPALREDTSITTRLRDDRSAVLRNTDRARLPARTAATRNSTHGKYTGAKSFACNHCGRNLLMWCQNKERHTLLTSRPWSSALLAAQRRRGHAAAGEVTH